MSKLRLMQGCLLLTVILGGILVCGCKDVKDGTLLPPPAKVANPAPADGVTDVPVTIDLTWGAAAWADSYDVYFGTVESAVADATTGSPEFKGNQTDTRCDPGLLAYSTTYYWRIDSSNSSDCTEGGVWQFTIEDTPVTVPVKVTGPVPVDGAADVVTSRVLSWNAASGAQYYGVYLGTTQSSVANAFTGSPEFKGMQTGLSYAPPDDLPYDTTYYWRIDGVNHIGNTKGDVWGFATIAQPIPVADFTATPAMGPVPLTVAFTDKSAGQITSWAWDFNNDTAIDATTRDAVHLFTSHGVYTIKLAVAGPGGSDEEVKVDYVVVADPSASFYGDFPTTSSITWHWDDNSTTETGFEIRNEESKRALDAPADATSVVETGLAQNTPHTRCCIPYAAIVDSESVDQAQDTDHSFSVHDNWGDDRQAQSFTTGTAGWLTKIDFYGWRSSSSVDLEISIYPTSGGEPDLSDEPLAKESMTLGPSQWYTVEFAEPAFLRDETRYAILFYSHGVYYLDSNKIRGSHDDLYARGSMFLSEDGGSTWVEEDGYDFAFRTHMIPETRTYSAPSNVATVWTCVHDPTKWDFSLVPRSDGKVDIGVVPPPNPTVGSTAVRIERILEGQNWDTDALEITGGYVNTYDIEDTVGATGVYLYRIMFRSRDGIETAWSPEKLTIVQMSAPAAPTTFSAAAVTATSIEWMWQDNSAAETGFEVLDGDNNLWADLPADTTSYNEAGFEENTTYTRHCRAYIATSRAEMLDQKQDTDQSARTVWNYLDYRTAQTFVPCVGGRLTKLEFYGRKVSSSPTPRDLIVSIYPTDAQNHPDISGVPLAVETITLETLAQWNTITFSTPPMLEDGETYAIAFYTPYVGNSTGAHYIYLSAGDEYIPGACFRSVGDAGDWFRYNHDVAFRTYMVPEGRGYSDPSNEVVAYSGVHDPAQGDFTLVDVGSGEVEIDVAEPNNSDAGLTGVFVQRIAEGESWVSDAVDVTSDFTNSYSVADSAIPATDRYHYRIRFRNGDGVETAWSPARLVVVVIESPDPPTNFLYDTNTVSASSITWTWEDNSSDEDGFEVRDSSGARVMDASANATSAIEDHLTENTACTRHVRAYTAFPFPEEVNQSQEDHPEDRFNNYGSYRHGQTFRLSVAGRLTRIELYGRKYSSSSLNVEVSIYPTSSIGNPVTSGKPLATATISTFVDQTTPTWEAAVFSPPAYLEADTTYVMVFYTPGATTVLQANRFYYSDSDPYPGGRRYNSYSGGAHWSYSYISDFAFRIYLINEGRGYSDASNETTVYTAVHDPTENDFTLRYNGFGEVEIDVRAPVNHDVGLTGVSVERAEDISFTTGVTLVQDFVGTYSLVDSTVPSDGVYYYRIMFRNAEGRQTAWSPGKPIEVIVEMPAAPANLLYETSTLSATSITWIWSDTSSNENGFEIQDESGNPVGDIGSDAISFTETGLTENTVYTRQARSYISVTHPETIDQLQEEYTWYADTASQERLAQTFTPGVTGKLVKLEIYGRKFGTDSYDLEISIYPTTADGEPDTSGDPLATESISLSDVEEWHTVTFSSPPFLKGGATYAMQFWTPDYLFPYQNSIGYSWSNPYSGGSLWHTNFGGYIWEEWEEEPPGDVAFRTYMVPETRGYSDASNQVTVYTAVRDPGEGDFTVTYDGFGQVEIVVTPPVNSDVGQTGVYVQRAADSGFTAGVTEILGFAANYTVVDSIVPLDGIYYYRIKFRNADGVETAWSPGIPEAVIVNRPAQPIGFYGDTPTTASVTWHWIDNSSDEDGFELQDGSGVLLFELASDTELIVETGLSENTAYTRHYHAFRYMLGAQSVLDQYSLSHTAQDFGGPWTPGERPPPPPYSNFLRAQTFTPGVKLRGKLAKAEIYGMKCSSSSGDLEISIYPTTVDGEPDMSGPAMASATVTLGETEDWHTAVFAAEPVLFEGIAYAMVFHTPGATEDTEDNSLFYHTYSDAYRRGDRFESSSGGATWGRPRDDYAFKTHMIPLIKGYSDPSNDYTIYTAVHDPQDSDFVCGLGEPHSFNTVLATCGSSPDVGFEVYWAWFSSLEDLHVQGDQDYWTCRSYNLPADTNLELWADFDFDISGAGISASEINWVEFTSKVFFTGYQFRSNSVPLPSQGYPMELYRISQARVQLYNFASTSWEDIGANFFADIGTNNWLYSAEAGNWDWIGDINPDNPIIRRKNSGWSAGYVSGGIMKLRVYIDASTSSSSDYDINWIFDHVRLDLACGSIRTYIFVTPPPNATEGLTGVYIERDTDPAFSSAVMLQDFAPDYTLVDTPPAPGTYYYRIMFCNGDGVPTQPSPAKSVTVP